MNYALKDLMFFAGAILSVTGGLLAGLLLWHIFSAMIRLILTLHTLQSLGLVLSGLAQSTRTRQSWEPMLRGLCLQLPWPWPWRLRNAANQLSQGVDAASVLESSALLPESLRSQASQALRSSPAAFCTWCDGIAAHRSSSQLVVRHVTFMLSQGMASVAIIYFIAVVIMPKFEQMFLELGIQNSRLFSLIEWFVQWKILFLITLFWVVVATVGISAKWSWRQRRQMMAGRLLVIGSAARMSEADLGTVAQQGMNFSELAAASGWKATSPKQLARVVVHQEFRQRQRATWLPAMCAAVSPIILAIPVGALVIGIMNLLITLMWHVEATG